MRKSDVESVSGARLVPRSRSPRWWRRARRRVLSRCRPGSRAAARSRLRAARSTGIGTPAATVTTTRSWRPTDASWVDARDERGGLVDRRAAAHGHLATIGDADGERLHRRARSSRSASRTSDRSGWAASRAAAASDARRRTGTGSIPRSGTTRTGPPASRTTRTSATPATKTTSTMWVHYYVAQTSGHRDRHARDVERRGTDVRTRAARSSATSSSGKPPARRCPSRPRRCSPCSASVSARAARAASRSGEHAHRGAPRPRSGCARLVAPCARARGELGGTYAGSLSLPARPARR